MGRQRSQRAAFDRLLVRAAPLISTQTHQRESPPQEGGRWPISLVFRPPTSRSWASRLTDLTEQCMSMAGPGHWWTGLPDAAHITVRALERYREHAATDDPAVDRYARAVGSLCAQRSPFAFRISGLTLTPSSIMACAVPDAADADRLMDALGPALGTDAWLEGIHSPRDIWYLNLVHFAAPIPHPEKLISWVEDRRNLDIGTMSVSSAEIIRCRYVEDDQRPRMRLETLRSCEIGAPAQPGFPTPTLEPGSNTSA